MYITGVKAFALRLQDDHTEEPAYSIAAGERRAYKSRFHETMVVRIETDEGIVGYGEGQSPISPLTTKTIVEDLCSPILMGADPFDTGHLWHRMFSSMRERGHSTGFFVDALAACDIALWDIIGKTTGKPVHKLLGGRYRDRIKLYAGCAGEDPSAVAARAAKLIEQGYEGLKLSLRSTRNHNLSVVSAVRECVGSAIALMVDVHTVYSVSEAIQLGRGLEKLDAFWLEAPTVPEDIQGCAEICRALDLQVAAGEWSRTRFEMREAFERRAYDVVTPDIGRTGLSEGMRIATLAETYNIPVSPHIGGGGILAIAATIQFSAAIPGFLIMEHGHEVHAYRSQIARRAPRPDDGAFILDDTPGLGVDIDEDALRRYAL